MKQSNLFPGIEKKPKKIQKEAVAQEWKVPSFTSEKEYMVRQEGKRWICSCLSKRKPCKHVVLIKERLGLAKPDLSGLKSAIQKSVRRGDLSLLKLSFGKLWELDRRWVLLRLPILAGEESDPYTGLAGRVSFKENPSRGEVWSVLANITLRPKCKEAEGLRIAWKYNLQEMGDWKPEDWVQGEKLEILKGWIEISDDLERAETDKEWWKRFEPKTEYAKETVRTCKRRFYYGGMRDDRELMVTVAYLACVENLEESELIDVPREEDVEPAKELPWYVWDMHTSIGKIALYSMKKKFSDKSQGDYVASELWFNCESAKCDRLVPLDRF